MSRERENYRANLEQISNRFGDRQLISRKEAAEFLGIDERTVKTTLTEKKAGGRYYVTAVDLARWLS